MRVVEAQCVGENSCTVRASNEIFEEPCYGTCVRACVRVRMRACMRAYRTRTALTRSH
jgi:hypothetical protein